MEEGCVGEFLGMTPAATCAIAWTGNFGEGHANERSGVFSLVTLKQVDTHECIRYN